MRKQAKKKENEIEELKEGVDAIEFQSVKTLEVLHFLKHEEAALNAEISLELIRSGISKELINFLKKLIIPRKHPHLVLEGQLRKYIMLNYY